MRKNALEWTVFAVSACIVLAATGYLTIAAVRAEKTPPDLRVFAGTPTAHAGVHRIPILVRNAGSTTAESVRVEVVLRRGEQDVARAELDIAFVPRQSEREGWVTFREDPRCCAIVARAASYEQP